MKALYLFLVKKHIAPRWAVFLADITVCSISLVFANYLRYNFSLSIIPDHYLIKQLFVLACINSFFFILFHTYEGIIRYSGLRESLRCVSALIYSFTLIFLANIIMRIVGQKDIIPMSVLIIYIFTASVLVFGYRFLVKSIYNQTVINKETRNVVIFGSEENGALLKRTIEQTGKLLLRVVAFVDNDESCVGKTIDNVKIYTFEEIKHVVSTWKIKILLFAKQDFDLQLKNEIVDFCLEHDITIKNVPPVSEWIHGQLTLNQIKDVKIEDLLNRPAIELPGAHISSFLKTKRILITGAAGSIGSEIARQTVAAEPESIILCDQTETALYELEYELRKKASDEIDLQVYIADVRDRKALLHLFELHRPDIVFHAAAYKHVPLMEKHPSEAVRNNVLGTKILADLSLQFGVERFLFISTDKAINPTNIMGASKRLAEMYVQSLNHYQNEISREPDGMNSLPIYTRNNTETKFITTRFGNVLGSNGSVIPRFKDQIENGGPVTVTHPDIIRYFMTIPEACSLVLEAVTMGNGGEIFLFDMGQPVKITDLAIKMIKLAGQRPGKDIRIEFTGLRPGEKLFEELLNKKEKVIPTHHKKILIAKVMEFDYNILTEKMKSLFSAALSNDDDEVVRWMKRIIPEYKSQNSSFERFDKEPEIVLSRK